MCEPETFPQPATPKAFHPPQEMLNVWRPLTFHAPSLPPHIPCTVVTPSHSMHRQTIAPPLRAAHRRRAVRGTADADVGGACALRGAAAAHLPSRCGEHVSRTLVVLWPRCLVVLWPHRLVVLALASPPSSIANSDARPTCLSSQCLKKTAMHVNVSRQPVSHKQPNVVSAVGADRRQPATVALSWTGQKQAAGLRLIYVPPPHPTQPCHALQTPCPATPALPAQSEPLLASPRIQ